MRTTRPNKTDPEIRASRDPRPIAVLARRRRAAWTPRPRLSTPDWCASHLRLPAETSSSPGRYNLRRFPYWRGVLDAVDDPEVETIAMMMGTQIGKTTALQAILASRPEVSPAPAMLAAPDRDATRELRDKFYKMADSTPRIASILPPTWRRNDQWVDFGNMLAHLAWSGNPQRLSGKACKYVLCTEIDRWQQPAHEGATQKLISERVKAFFRHLIVYESTPTDETSAIADLYDRSDQRKFWVPCPHCGHFQELRFFLHKDGPFSGAGGIGGLQHPSGEWLTPEEAREAAHYICERGCRIDSPDKAGMIARGLWVPRGQTVSRAGMLRGEPERPPRHSGFQLWSLYAETIDFGRVAAEYLESRESEPALRSFWNNWLGLRWSSKTKAPKWQRVGRRLKGAHRRGTVPAWAFFLTAGIDTQDDCAYWVVRAWGEGSTSALVDWGKVQVRVDENGQPIPSSDLDQLDELLLDRSFPLIQPNPVGREQLRVRLANIDYQGHRTWDVFQWVRARSLKGVERLRIIAGDTRVPAGEFYRMSIVERHAGTGKAYPGGLKRWAIDVDSYKADLQARFEAALDKPGAWFLTEDILELGQDYLRQICNEGLRRKRDKRGREVMAWEVIDTRVGNHDWDCEVYNRAAADMVTGQDWTDLARRAGPVKEANEPRQKPRRRNAESPSSNQGPYGRYRS